MADANVTDSLHLDKRPFGRSPIMTQRRKIDAFRKLRI